MPLITRLKKSARWKPSPIFFPRRFGVMLWTFFLVFKFVDFMRKKSNEKFHFSHIVNLDAMNLMNFTSIIQWIKLQWLEILQ